MRGPITLNWKLRRIAFGFRQQDLASILGMSASRYSAIERGDLEATSEETINIERLLPDLPVNPSVKNVMDPSGGTSESFPKEWFRREPCPEQKKGVK